LLWFLVTHEPFIFCLFYDSVSFSTMKLPAELKGRVHCFSLQIVMNKWFLLNREKKIGTDPSCRFREKRTFNSENWRHRAEGSATLITSYKLLTGYKSVLNFGSLKLTLTC